VIPTTVGALPHAAALVGAGPALVMVGEVYADMASAGVDSLPQAANA
jgi:NADH:ubiquinone oxidoreductase subunit 5 (subunit L)/multisubunit Na+/H+ antiporter MnhA subunit